MGCGMAYLKWLAETDRLPRGGRLLDIGESCLLAATADEIRSIWDRYGCSLSPAERDRLAPEYARRSTLIGDPNTPTLFLSEVLIPTSVTYAAIDVVAMRPGAYRFDLNKHNLARAKQGAFDIVVNFGTTEHVMNQYNSYKVIHEATAVGGYMFHQVPGTGYISHGYFTYDALMFRELAQANGYDLLDLWYTGPQGAANVMDNAAKHPSVRDKSKVGNEVAAFEAAPVPNSVINVLLRKTRAAPFAVGLEVQTAAGALDAGAAFSEYVEPDPLPETSKPAAKAGWFGRLMGRAA